MRSLAATAPGGVAQMQGVGLGWQVWQGGQVRAAGANPGQSGVIAVDVSERAAIVALTNADLGVNAVTSAIDPGTSDSGAGPPLSLDRYAGRYASHAGVLTVALDGEKLSATLTGYEYAAPLSPTDEITVSSPLGPLAFFAPDEDGRPQLLRARMRVMRRIA
jgi:hypothetical protein